MSQRVSDHSVERFLRWGLNYGEIEAYKRIATSGRKWRIQLPFADLPISLSGKGADYSADGLVPAEFVLTSREALAFGYGLAVAGARTETRRELAVRKWGWE